MWRMKVTVVTIVVLGALMFGAVVAYAGWGWNAKVNIEGTKLSLSWAVTDDVSGAADYHAVITVKVPSDADVKEVKVAPTETLIWDRTGDCSDGVVITYEVTGDGGGSAVAVSVDRVGGGGKMHYGDDTGIVGDLGAHAPSVTIHGLLNCSG